MLDGLSNAIRDTLSPLPEEYKEATRHLTVGMDLSKFTVC